MQGGSLTAALSAVLPVKLASQRACHKPAAAITKYRRDKHCCRFAAWEGVWQNLDTMSTGPGSSGLMSPDLDCRKWR